MIGNIQQLALALGMYKVTEGLAPLLLYQVNSCNIAFSVPQVNTTQSTLVKIAYCI